LDFGSKIAVHLHSICFPEEICKLRQLEKLYICNGKYSEERGFYPPCKEKADAWIPGSVDDNLGQYFMVRVP
jgi:hypothetical protein